MSEELGEINYLGLSSSLGMLFSSSKPWQAGYTFSSKAYSQPGRSFSSYFPQGAFIGYYVFFQTEVLFLLNSLEILRSRY